MFKKVIIAAFAIMLIASVCLFAATTVSTTNFKLKHVVNVTAQYYFEFWNPATSRHITEVALNNAGRTVFATLTIVFNSTANLGEVSISFEDLKSAANEYYPYTLEVLKPDMNEHYVEITPTAGKHGAGTAVLFDNKTFNYDVNGAAWNTIEVCDLAVTLDDSDVAIGSYSGDIRIRYTTP